MKVVDLMNELIKCDLQAPVIVYDSLTMAEFQNLDFSFHIQNKKVPVIVIKKED